MKNFSNFKSTILAIAFMTVLFAGFFDALGQSTTQILRTCPGVNPTVKEAKVEVQKDGNLNLIPCATKSVLIGGSSIDSTLNGGVKLGLPSSLFSSPNTFIKSGGTLTASLISQTQNQIFASPGGANGSPTFRYLLPGDIPALDAAKTTTGVFSAARLGLGTANNSTFLRGDGAWAALPSAPISAVSGEARTGYIPFFDAENTLAKSPVRSQNGNDFVVFPGDDDFKMELSRNGKSFELSSVNDSRYFLVDFDANEIVANLPDGNITLGDGTGTNGFIVISNSSDALNIKAKNISITGTNDVKLVSPNGNNLSFNGSEFFPNVSNQVNFGAVNLRLLKGYFGRVNTQLSTPPNNAQTCQSGDIWADTEFIYVCTSTNNIKRAELKIF